MKQKLLYKLCCALFLVCFTSCSTSKLVVSSVAYQSVRPINPPEKEKDVLPQDAVIVVEPIISNTGELSVQITNLTEKVMIIDKTKSFYLSPQGTSTIYYDPTVKVETLSSTEGQGRGASVNLGAVAGAFGVRGIAGAVLGGITTGRSSNSSTTVTNTTYDADSQTLSIAPYGKATLKRTFTINGLGKDYTKTLAESTFNTEIVNTYDTKNPHADC